MIVTLFTIHVLFGTRPVCIQYPYHHLPNSWKLVFYTYNLCAVTKFLMYPNAATLHDFFNSVLQPSCLYYLLLVPC